MAKLVGCKELLIFFLLVIIKSRKLQLGLASKGHSDLLCGVPYIQAGKEAIILGFDAGFLGR